MDNCCYLDNIVGVFFKVIINNVMYNMNVKYSNLLQIILCDTSMILYIINNLMSNNFNCIKSTVCVNIYTPNVKKKSILILSNMML